MLYVVGVPGVGKTTLLRRVLPDPIEERIDPFPHLVYAGGAQLGSAREEFGGTDALAMSVQPQVEEWLREECPFDTIVAEGDRLANLKFFRAVAGMGWGVHLVELSAMSHVILARRKARGSQQDQSWLRGRVSKVRRLIAGWSLFADRDDLSFETIPMGTQDQADVAIQRLRARPEIQRLRAADQ